jgi:hypothetical protein
VKVAGCVGEGSVEPWVPVCAGKQDLPLSELRVMEPGAMTSGVGDWEC